LYPASRRAPTSSSLYPAEVGAASGSKRMATVNTGKFVLGASLSIVIIGGCAPTFTVDGSRNPAEPAVRQVNNTSMDPALLRHQPKPDCAFRGPVSDPITAEETRQKLDYEQHCYRQAETIVRARLERLQNSVQEMIKVARER
jgi:hypothetical protein